MFYGSPEDRRANERAMEATRVLRNRVHSDWKHHETGRLLFFRWPAQLGCLWWYGVVDALEGLDPMTRDATLDQMAYALTTGTKKSRGEIVPTYYPGAKAVAYLRAVIKLRKEVPEPTAFLEALRQLKPDDWA